MPTSSSNPRPKTAPDELLLLPMPRSVRASGAFAPVPSPLHAAVESLWSSLNGGPGASREAQRLMDPRGDGDRSPNRDAYALSIHPGADGAAQVRIAAHTRKGHRAATATLRQLLRQFPASLPCLEIEDHPGFTTRGVMLDVSRDKVPTMAQLRETVDLLAELKYNHLQLYTEHTFAYTGHEEAWRDWSPMTPAEVRELDGFCRDRGIELAANQNCFGHLASWLRLPKYTHLAEIEGEAEWRFMEFPRKGPFSLAPMLSESEAFVRDLLGQLLPCFSSGLVNIGCDETFDVGWGKSRAEVAKRGRAAVYWDFVRTIATIARVHGKRPMMWADIALTDPASLVMMPADMIGLAWGYEPDAKFAEWCEVLRSAPGETGKHADQHGRKCWVCPGTSSWRSITGRTSERRANINAAASQGSTNGATGFLITDWGDSGHHQHLPVALMGIGHAAHAAWNPERSAEFDARAASLHVLGDPSLTLGPWLDELGDADLTLRRTARVPWMNIPGIRNASALFTDLHPPLPAPMGWNQSQSGRTVMAPLAEWERTVETIQELASRIPPDVPPLISDELSHTADYASFMAEHAVAWRRAKTGPSRVERLRLRDWCNSLLSQHRELWTRRNRPGGLTHSTSFFEKSIAALSGEGT